MTPSPALTAMRAATASAHQGLEQGLEIAAPGASRQAYLDYLADMHGWLSAFEAPLWTADWPAGVEPAARSGKLAWIEQDLNKSGMPAADIGALPRAAFAPDLSGLASRFGLAYVIEGSQLGTKQLQQRLSGALDGWEPRWLEGYGSRNGSNWRAFLHALEQYVRTPQEIDEACAAAAAAFVSLAAWFEQRRAERAAIALASEE